MWFQICVSVLLVHAISTNLARHDQKFAAEANKEEADAIFASVIKNISRVNHVLQELINNYEHLQKIYKSQENLESESSDEEIDEVYKIKKNRDEQERSKTDFPSTPPADGYPATQMIWSDNNNDEDSDVGSDSDSDDSNVTDNQVIEKHFDLQEPAKPQKSEIIFVDMHSTTKKKKSRPSLEPIIIETATSKPVKTRYSKVSKIRTGSINHKEHKKKKKHENRHLTIEDVKKTNDSSKSEPNTIVKNTLDPKRGVEKKLQTEIFSPKNIWDEIISNRPIQLQAHSELTLEKFRKDNNNRRSNRSLQEIRQRTSDSNTSLIIVTNKNQTEKLKKPLADNSGTDEDGGKAEFQATVLREAYGDACLKVVVKKCYKACKAAGKEVCERYKCKSNYKQKFNEYVKTGCIREFHGNTSDYNDADASVEFRGDGTRSGVKHGDGTKNNPLEKIEDITTNGYLRSCLPHLQPESRRAGDIAKESPEATTFNLSNALPKINILRDKYEKACNKISQSKCKRACGYSYKKVCESFTCNSARKKAYKKQCSVKCKSAYKKGGSHVSSSSSDSNSESSSGSASSNSS